MQYAGDARILLQAAIDGPVASFAGAAPPSFWRRAIPIVALAMALSGLTVWNIKRPAPEEAALKRFVIESEAIRFIQSGNERSLTLSEDGSLLAYVSQKTMRRQ